MTGYSKVYLIRNIIESNDQIYQHQFYNNFITIPMNHFNMHRQKIFDPLIVTIKRAKIIADIILELPPNYKEFSHLDYNLK